MVRLGAPSGPSCWCHRSTQRRKVWDVSDTNPEPRGAGKLPAAPCELENHQPPKPVSSSVPWGRWSTLSPGRHQSSSRPPTASPRTSAHARLVPTRCSCGQIPRDGKSWQVIPEQLRERSSGGLQVCGSVPSRDCRVWGRLYLSQEKPPILPYRLY